MASSRKKAASGEFAPVEFVKAGGDGKETSRFAHSPSEVTALRFDGWREKVAGSADKSVGAVIEAAEEKAAATSATPKSGPKAGTTTTR
jgi:hypothetical protein